MRDDEGSYEISALIGPCTRREAEDMLIALADDGRFGQAYGACWAMQEIEPLGK